MLRKVWDGITYSFHTSKIAPFKFVNGYLISSYAIYCTLLLTHVVNKVNPFHTMRPRRDIWAQRERETRQRDGMPGVSELACWLMAWHEYDLRPLKLIFGKNWYDPIHFFLCIWLRTNCNSLRLKTCFHLRFVFIIRFCFIMLLKYEAYAVLDNEKSPGNISGQFWNTTVVW